MPEDIIAKLHTALYHISPLASDRERIIEKMGETIWLETLEKVLTSLDEGKRAEAVDALNNGDVAKAVAIFEASGIDLDTVITEVSTSVMNEVLATVK